MGSHCENLIWKSMSLSLARLDIGKATSEKYFEALIRFPNVMRDWRLVATPLTERVILSFTFTHEKPVMTMPATLWSRIFLIKSDGRSVSRVGERTWSLRLVSSSQACRRAT